MKHIQIFEDFKQGPMRKPQGFFSKLAQGTKHALGFENAEDRKRLESLERAIASSSEYGWVKSVREVEPGVLVAWVADNSVTVNKNTPEILYKGKVLDLHNIEDEVEFLYSALKKISENDSIAH